MDVVLLQEAEIRITAAVELGMQPGGAGFLCADTEQKHAGAFSRCGHATPGC